MRRLEKRPLQRCKLKNWVVMALHPMNNKENRSGQCIGAEVKNLSKISWRLEAVSMVLCYVGLNHRYYGTMEATGLIIVLCKSGACCV